MTWVQNEFIAGGIAGIVGTTFGFPLDSLKTIQQNQKKIQFKNLHSGISSALILSFISQSICFGISETNSNNYYLSGAIAGVINGCVSNPLELIKIQNQMGKRISLVNINRGLPLTLTREIFSNSVYFGTYHDTKSSIGIFHAGGLAGMLSWLITYPVDVMKTRIQTNMKITYVDALSKGKLTNGLGFCLARAYIVNSISFVVYEKLVNPSD